ncbi:MAG TPA: cell division protein FtsZ [Alphaproteobacteria bacterium]|nr:cell division protein FtsZ [Alphaproteobacteria bacterium]
MINVRAPEAESQLHPRITVIGVGGAGGNAVNNMIRSNLEGVEFLVCNTDAQALTHSAAERRIQLGLNITRGLGAGSRPDVGRAAAEEALEELFGYLEGSNMVFITAGMGGGTGTGAAPVIARAAREHNILTVGVVTKPFQFEGAHRMRTAEAGIQELQQYVDTLIVIPNQNLFRIANEKTTFADAFKMADEVLHSGVRGVTDLMVMPGLINLDFADIRTVMSEMGKAMMGTGEAEGQRRAIDAAEAAISNPLLDEVSLKGARAMLINITAGMDIALFEVDEAVNRVRAEVDPDANVIFGSTFDPTMEGRLRVSVVATGIDAQSMMQQPPVRQPTLDVIRGGADTSPIRKTSVGGFAAMASSPAWPAMSPGMVAAPVSMTATAEQLQPQIEETAVVPAPEMPVEAAPEAVTEAQVEAVDDAAPAAQATFEPAGGFIPPRPAESFARQPVQQAAPQPAPEQPAPAPAVEKKRAFSLFERVTGAVRRSESAAAQPAAPAPAGERAAPTFGARMTPPPRQPDTTMVPMGQPRLGIDAPAKAKTSSPEDDLLEIPAFLRRQAN